MESDASEAGAAHRHVGGCIDGLALIGWPGRSRDLLAQTARRPASRVDEGELFALTSPRSMTCSSRVVVKVAPGSRRQHGRSLLPQRPPRRSSTPAACPAGTAQPWPTSSTCRPRADRQSYLRPGVHRAVRPPQGHLPAPTSGLDRGRGCDRSRIRCCSITCVSGKLRQASHRWLTSKL